MYTVAVPFVGAQLSADTGKFCDYSKTDSAIFNSIATLFKCIIHENIITFSALSPTTPLIMENIDWQIDRCLQKRVSIYL